MISVARWLLCPLAFFILASALALPGFCAELTRVRMGLAARSTTSMTFADLANSGTGMPLHCFGR